MAKYPIFLELSGRRAVVIGGGAVAVRKAQALLAAGARLVVVAERVDDGSQFDLSHLLLWQGERWAVGAAAFTWWVNDVVIAETRSVTSYDEWLMNKRYRILLTQEQWELLVTAIRGASGRMIEGVGSMVRALLDELTRGKRK